MANDTGYLTFWRATLRDAAGRLTNHLSGNDLIKIRDYHPGTGQLLAIESGFDYGNPIRAISYSYSYDKLDHVQGVRKASATTSRTASPKPRSMASSVASATQTPSAFSTTPWATSAIGF